MEDSVRDLVVDSVFDVDPVVGPANAHFGRNAFLLAKEEVSCVQHQALEYFFLALTLLRGATHRPINTNNLALREG